MQHVSFCPTTHWLTCKNNDLDGSGRLQGWSKIQILEDTCRIDVNQSQAEDCRIELAGEGGWARLVVLAAEPGGPLSGETAQFLQGLAKAGVQFVMNPLELLLGLQCGATEFMVLDVALFAKDTARAGFHVGDPVIALVGTPTARRCVQATFVFVQKPLNLQLSCARSGSDAKLLGSVV